MFKVNEYFEGNVKSLAYEDEYGKATLGVMAPGEYEFGTSQREYMTVITGEMKVKLPGASDWQLFKENETFIVEPDKKFQLELEMTSTYLCRYQEVNNNCGCSNCDC
jgi:purine/pyrimidine-nucleoside phosphorylase